jgi:tRNA pseudouridine55 synthase
MPLFPLSSWASLLEKHHGVLCVDKPQGWSSFDVVAKLRNVTGVRKIGHAGTLDPLATGLLLVLVGKAATARQEELMHQDKKYLVTARLGWRSDTYDWFGHTIEITPWAQIEAITEKQVTEWCQAQVGPQLQRAPAYSALQKGGQRLYSQAVKGQLDLAELPVREVTIHQCQVLGWKRDEKLQLLEVSLEVQCSSGTYIRSLVSDLGTHFQVGALVRALRRTAIGDISIENCDLLSLAPDA